MQHPSSLLFPHNTTSAPPSSLSRLLFEARAKRISGSQLHLFGSPPREKITRHRQDRHTTKNTRIRKTPPQSQSSSRHILSIAVHPPFTNPTPPNHNHHHRTLRRHHPSTPAPLHPHTHTHSHTHTIQQHTISSATTSPPPPPPPHTFDQQLNKPTTTNLLLLHLFPTITIHTPNRMTSIAPSSTAAPSASTTTNTTSSSSTAPARTTSSVSGQTAAAVPANAPASRVSYAKAVNKNLPPTGPGAASASNPVTTSSGGAVNQHARTASTSSAPVNGNKIQPAVPQIGSSGNSVANGVTSTPYSGGQHSRRSSIATGAMPNGASRGAPNIKFGAINEPGSGPQASGSAVAAGGNLTAPVASNPRANSPSPSAAAQPAASGGAPPSASTARPIQFGDTTPQRPSQPPQPQQPPQGPMASQPGHGRRDPAQAPTHGESGPTMPHGRGMPQNRRGNHGQGGYTPNYPNPSYGYGRGGYQPNAPRNGPTNMGPAPYSHQQYPNSPRAVPRSPALPQAGIHSPSMAPAVPTSTPQLYPPTHGFIPGTPGQVCALRLCFRLILADIFI